MEAVKLIGEHDLCAFGPHSNAPRLPFFWFDRFNVMRRDPSVAEDVDMST
jgi:hypothetical protein